MGDAGAGTGAPVETATFDQPGTYQFLCTVHAGMRGTLTVDS